jgi:NAD(P)-dependent dehydrogenase (short-subunit alcohol dehydrogenase family)
MNKNAKGTIIILGFNGVIGMACTSRLLKDDYKVLGTHSGNNLLDKNSIQDFKKKYGESLSIFKLDVTKSDDINKFKVYLRERHSDIQAIICNIGILTHDFSLIATEDKLNKIISINFTNPILVVNSIITQYIRKGIKSVVFISSTSSIEGDPGRLQYSASKSALNAASKVLSKELGKSGVRVNAVLPGLIDSPMLFQNTSKNEIDFRILQLSLRRLGQGFEVANLVHFLVSDESSYITGQNIRIDGGM